MSECEGATRALQQQLAQSAAAPIPITVVMPGGEHEILQATVRQTPAPGVRLDAPSFGLTGTNSGAQGRAEPGGEGTADSAKHGTLADHFTATPSVVTLPVSAHAPQRKGKAGHPSREGLSAERDGNGGKGWARLAGDRRQTALMVTGATSYHLVTNRFFWYNAHMGSARARRVPVTEQSHAKYDVAERVWSRVRAAGDARRAASRWRLSRLATGKTGPGRAQERAQDAAEVGQVGTSFARARGRPRFKVAKSPPWWARGFRARGRPGQIACAKLAQAVGSARADGLARDKGGRGMTATAEHETLQSLTGGQLQPLVRVECAEGGPCDVVEVVAPLLRVEAEGPDVGPEAWVNAARSGLRAPCCVCRVGVAELRALSGLRLGARERRVLLGASPAETRDSYHMARAMDIAGDTQQRRGWRDGRQGEWTVGSHSEQSATRRAIHKLQRAGLVASAYRHGLRVKLTILGAAVVDDFRAALEDGKRIRWAGWIAAGTLDLRASLHDRIKLFAEACRQAAKEREGAVKWGESIGVPPIPIFQQMHEETKAAAVCLRAWADAAEGGGGPMERMSDYDETAEAAGIGTREAQG